MKQKGILAFASAFSLLLSVNVSANVMSGVQTEEVSYDDCYFMQLYSPVCAEGITYMNAGHAFCSGMLSYTPGECAAFVAASEMTTDEVKYIVGSADTDYFGDIDSDQDGLSDLLEENLGTDPTNKDTDADGTWDAAEVAMGLSPLNNDLLFTDFDEVEWARDYIIDLVSRGALNGFEDGSFRPDELVTRAELLKIMVEAMHYDLGQVDESDTFNDVDPSHWSSLYTSFARGAGIVSGYPDGSFKPFDSITRSEAIKIMSRLVGFPLDIEVDPYFKDLSTWQIPYVENARRKGIVSESPDNLFRPNDFITRAEVAKIASNFLQGRY